MPYSSCPVCGDRFHLLVREGLKDWHTSRGIRIGEEASELCFGCWRDLQEYDVVEVISTPSDVTGVDAGELGAVVMIHERNGAAGAYEVECVLPDGRSKWLGSFKRQHLRYRIDQNKNTELANTGQPATRPVVGPEDGDKPQPDAEGRAR